MDGADSKKDDYCMNQFFKEYISYLVANEGKVDKDFLTNSFHHVPLKNIPFIYALMDLPTSVGSLSSHKFQGDGGRGMNITAGNNAVLFKREVKEG